MCHTWSTSLDWDPCQAFIQHLGSWRGRGRCGMLGAVAWAHLRLGGHLLNSIPSVEGEEWFLQWICFVCCGYNLHIVVDYLTSDGSGRLVYSGSPVWDPVLGIWVALRTGSKRFLYVLGGDSGEESTAVLVRKLCRSCIFRCFP